ncbi:hypothetical protein L1987_01493 [Smallanthus sonchifolius]|uniref:Uncharacterized protein n=1 Tax=Smallanthus sonchifolius TaxID=185202 RepID=A0ACB9K5G5_9ASTR|nr:hypothetical protein L1987_01493 [Smallanthus sonchifolius]
MTDNRIIPLDFDSIDGVPESHSWPPFDEPLNKIQTCDLQDSLIPVIDLTNSKAMNLVGQACKTWGMFQVINHGVSSNLVKKIESESRRLFALPAHEKCRVLRSSNGVTGYGSARISPFFDKGMWHEGFTFMGSCVDDAKVLWPHDFQRFCDTMDAYQNQVKQLTHELLLMILETLDVTQEEIDWAISTHHSQNALQLNSYPSCPNPSHALGDLLHIFNNAKFPVVSHRAVVNQSKHRISVAYFHGPPVESRVAPSAKFQKPCFKSLLVKEYLSLKSKHYEALSWIRT